MNNAQQKAMFAYMKAVGDDAFAPDGAWQAKLEDAAEQWGKESGVSVDGFDAFMDYITTVSPSPVQGPNKRRVNNG